MARSEALLLQTSFGFSCLEREAQAPSGRRSFSVGLPAPYVQALPSTHHPPATLPLPGRQALAPAVSPARTLPPFHQGDSLSAQSSRSPSSCKISFLLLLPSVYASAIDMASHELNSGEGWPHPPAGPFRFRTSPIVKCVLFSETRSLGGQGWRPPLGGPRCHIYHVVRTFLSSSVVSSLTVLCL